MLRKVRKYISHNQLIGDSGKILLAVSGGPDSVAMAHMMHRLHIEFGICHVNFHLRGADSDADEQFVREMAAKLNAPIYVLQANTKLYAQEHGISIEMAAREIRYAEFQRIMDLHGYQHTAVAHHKDDAIETFLLNLTRGAGIRGLTGIRIRNQRIIRPLLCLYRSDIMQYIQQNQLQYRTDKTNLESDFARNKIRNLAMPILEQINPSARRKISDSLAYLGMASRIYQQCIQQALQAAVIESATQKTIISIPRIMEFAEPECLLYEAVSTYGFGSAQCQEIAKALQSTSGKTFSSHTHRLIKNRNEIIIEPIKAQQEQQGIIMELTLGLLQTPHNKLLVEKIDPKDFAPKRDHSAIYLDYDKLSQSGLPISITGWAPGDHITMFGGKRKKVSDILIDNKLSLSDKEKVEILRLGNSILWIVGIRASNLCTVEPNTKTIIKITAN